MALLTKNKVIGSKLLVIAGLRTGDGTLKAQAVVGEIGQAGGLVGVGHGVFGIGRIPFFE